MGAFHQRRREDVHDVVVFEDLAFLALLKFAKKLLSKFQEGTACKDSCRIFYLVQSHHCNCFVYDSSSVESSKARQCERKKSAKLPSRF